MLERDEYMCQLRIPNKCEGRANEAHHTLGKAVTGDDPKYMVASCKPCNLHIGDPTAIDPIPHVVEWWKL